MEVQGWRLYQYPLFEQQLRALTDTVAELAKKQPDSYKEHPSTRLLATVFRYITEVIPRDPNVPEFRQGNTLGPENRHWFRAKFLERYRLFYRFSSKEKIIIYAWMNDEQTLRQKGAKTDVYAVFKAMLKAGEPPQSVDQLLQHAHDLKLQVPPPRHAAPKRPGGDVES